MSFINKNSIARKNKCKIFLAVKNVEYDMKNLVLRYIKTVKIEIVSSPNISLAIRYMNNPAIIIRKIFHISVILTISNPVIDDSSEINIIPPDGYAIEVIPIDVKKSIFHTTYPLS
jgi:hypothetical protein